MRLLTAPNHPIELIQEILSHTQRAYLTSPYVKEIFIRKILPQLQEVEDIKLLVRLTSYEVSTKSRESLSKK